MAAYDVAIIGGGVIGMSLAWRLQTRGARVVVIDAGPAIPPATLAAAGMLAPSFEAGEGPLNDALYAFGINALDRWPGFAAALEAETGRAIDFRNDGVLGVAQDEIEADRLRGDVETLRRRGSEARLIDAGAARGMEPALGDRISCAMIAPRDGQVDPVALADALRAALRRSGGVLRAGARAARIHAEADAARGVILEDGTRIAAGAVALASGAAAAGKIAAGGSSREIAAPVFPVKGEALALCDPAQTLRGVVRGRRAYLCPKADGRIVIGATEVPNDPTLEVSPEAIDRLKEAAAALAPSLAPLAERARWAGLRPGTPDGAPIIGPDPAGPRGLVFALGHYRNGVLLATATADILARHLLDGGDAPELETFSINRFAD